MPKLNMAFSHQLPQEEALRRIKNFLGELKKQYANLIGNLREEWSGNTGSFSFSAMGFPVSGILTVEQNEVQFFGNLPLSAVFFKRKIESTIREKATALLA